MFQDYKVAYLRETVKVREAKRMGALRQTMAYIQSISARQTPHAAMISNIDVTPVLEFAKARGEELAKASDKGSKENFFLRAIYKTHSAFFLKAIAHALHHTPCMNAFIDYAPWRYGGTLYHAEDVNIGFTVHTKHGVLRPVMRNAHLKGIVDVAQEMRELSRRARKTEPERLFHETGRKYLVPALKQLDFRAIFPGFLLLRDLLFPSEMRDPDLTKVPPEERLAPEDILGATCSIANIGMVVPGNQTVTVLTPPEVMMFGFGDIHPEPRVLNGEIVIRQMATLCATMDHRAYDAGEAFPFGEHFFRYVANPELIYDWKSGDPV